MDDPDRHQPIPHITIVDRQAPSKKPPPEPAPIRKPFQFSLRTLLWVVTGTAILCSAVVTLLPPLLPLLPPLPEPLFHVSRGVEKSLVSILVVSFIILILTTRRPPGPRR